MHYSSADLAVFMLDGQLWWPHIAKDNGARGAAGVHTFQVRAGFFGPLNLYPIEAIDPDDGTVSLGWNIWSDDPVLINHAARPLAFPISGGSGDMQPQSYLVEVPFLDIVSPEEGADYDVSDENYTTTPPIPFRAKVVPEELSQRLSDINWTLDLEYDTTISRGPWTSQKTFQTQHDTIHHETYSSEGGEIEVNAEASLDGVPLTANQVFTVTGVSIPDEVITERLINLYNGATPNLLTGIATVESGIGCYCQFYEIAKYDVTDRWPRESYDGGSHIGLMQVPVAMEDAWNWLTNTQTAANIITGNIQQSHNHVNNIRQEHPDLRDLTDVEHEDNALALYNTGSYYYSPNANFTDWLENPNNSEGVDYADDVRNNVR